MILVAKRRKLYQAPGGLQVQVQYPTHIAGLSSPLVLIHQIDSKPLLSLLPPLILCDLLLHSQKPRTLRRELAQLIQYQGRQAIDVDCYLGDLA